MAKAAASKTDIDSAVINMLTQIEAKKKELAKAKVRPVWKTSCTFGRDPSVSTNRTNIQTVRDIRTLVEIYGFLNTQEKELDLAADQLGVNVTPTWQNYTFLEWKEDLQTRVGQLSIEEKQKELDELDRRVNSLVTPEQRRAMELEALQKILGS